MISDPYRVLDCEDMFNIPSPSVISTNAFSIGYGLYELKGHSQIRIISAIQDMIWIALDAHICLQNNNHENRTRHNQ
jgi:hypothetical protein